MLHARRFGGPFNALHDRIDDFRDQFPGFYINEIKLRDNVMKVLSFSKSYHLNATTATRLSAADWPFDPKRFSQFINPPLLRRISLDATGLPFTPCSVDATSVTS